MAVVYTRYAVWSIRGRPRLTETLPTSALHRRAPLGGSQPRRRLRRDPRGPAPRLPALLSGQIAEEFGECPVVGGDGGGVGVLARAVEAVAADAADDGIGALLVVEAPLRGAVLAQEIGAVSLIGHGLLEAANLWPVQVGVVWWVGVFDHHGDAGFAKRRQVGGDLGDGLAVQARVVGREADVKQCLGQVRDLVAGLVGGLDPGEVDGGPPGFFGGGRVGGEQAGQAGLQLDQGIVAPPRVGAVAAAADRAQGGGERALGVGHDPQPSVLAANA